MKKMIGISLAMAWLGLIPGITVSGCGGEGPVEPIAQPDNPEGKDDSSRPWWCFPPFCRAPENNEKSGESIYKASRAQLTHALTQTPDGGYVLVGESALTNNDFMALFALKVDARGNKQWIRNFDGKGEDAAHDLVALDDGSVVIVGNSEVVQGESGGDYDAIEGRIIQLDPSGNTVWDRLVGMERHDELRSIARTPDGGLVALGFTHAVGDGDFFLVKLDAAGQILWTRTLGGPDGTDVGKSVKVLKDGGLVLGGTRLQEGKMRAFVIHTDAAGNELGAYTYGDPTRDVSLEDLTLTRDGGVVLAGYVATNFFDAPDRAGWVSRIELSGQTLWTKEIGGEVWDHFASAAPTSDGGIILAGQTRSIGHPGALVNDVLLVKLASDGTLQWRKAKGDGYDNYADCVVQNTQGDFAVGATTMSGLLNFFDVYLLRLAPTGDL